MRRHIKIATTVVLLSLCISSTTAQIKHGSWNGVINVRSSSLMVPFIPKTAWEITKSFLFEDDEWLNRWVKINSEYEVQCPKWSVSDANGEHPLSSPYWWKWILCGDYDHTYTAALGYSISFRPFDFPVGFNVGLNHEWRGFCIDNSTLQGLHRTTSLIPSVGISLHRPNFDKETSSTAVYPQVDFYASFVINQSYNNPLNFNRNIINNGWRLSVGVGLYLYNSYGYVRYEWDCYNYFNIPDVSTRFGCIVIGSSIML